MQAGEGVDLVHDLSQPIGFRVAHVDCCSVLEHCDDPFAVARNLSDALLPGGTILLSVPFVWRVHAYPSDYWRFTVEGIRKLFPAIAWPYLAYAYESRESSRFKVTASEKGTGMLPKCEVVGWGFKQ
jgi:SAM-dependent methyltransferase